MAAGHIRLSAPAKINLHLKITGRRADGYHELDTLMQKLALFDELDMASVQEPGVVLSCPDSELPEDEGNIVYRAARMFLDRAERRRQGIRIVLRKKIPLAAGLGGGSSDGAAVLLGLDRLLEPSLPAEQIAAMALELGADVPFFVCDTSAARATGVGERLEPVASLAGYRVLLVNPGIAVSTKWAYETFALTSVGNTFNLKSSQFESRGSDDPAPQQNPLQTGSLFNDLERVTCSQYGVIGRLKERLLAGGAAGALMSGSGPTVFGLFRKDMGLQAELCCRELQKEYSQVYLVDPLA